MKQYSYQIICKFILKLGNIDPITYHTLARLGSLDYFNFLFKAYGRVH